MTAICGLVLAGGASRRMGVNKLAMPATPGGPPVLAAVMRAVAAVSDQLYVVGEPGVALPAVPVSAAMVPDPVPQAGPLAALAAVWPRLAGFDMVVVAPGDVPGLRAEVLAACAARLEAGGGSGGHGGRWPSGADGSGSTAADCALVVREGRLQPLLGAYRLRAGRAWRAAHAAGETRLMAALAELAAVPVDGQRLGWPDWWTRPVHTPADYEAWLQEGRPS